MNKMLYFHLPKPKGLGYPTNEVNDSRITLHVTWILQILKALLIELKKFVVVCDKLNYVCIPSLL